MTRFSLHFFALYAFISTVAPYLQKFLAALGYGEDDVGLLQGLLGLSGVVGVIGLGQLADRLGRRRLVLIVSAALATVGFVPLAWATSLTSAVVLMLAIGAFFRITMSLSDAMASAELDEPDHQYGKARFWGTVGWIVTLGTIRIFNLVDEHEPLSMLWAIVICGGFCTITAMLLPDRHRRRKTSDPPPVGQAHWLLFWVGMFVISTGWFAMSSHGSFFTLFLEQRFEMKSGAWVWTLGAIAELPVLFYGGWLLRKMRMGPMALVSLLAASMRLALYAVAPHVAVVMVAQALHALSFGTLHIAAMSFIRRTTPHHRRGLAMALYMAAAMGGPGMLGSTLGGYIIKWAGYETMYLIYAGAPLVGASVLLLGWRRLSELQQTAPATPAPTASAPGAVAPTPRSK